MNKLIDLIKNDIHRWLTPKAESFQSPIHGLGIRAKEDIKAGEDILVYGGVIIHKSQIEEFWSFMGHIGTQIDDDFFIVPTSMEEVCAVGAVNHSCDPNAGFKDQIQLVAITDIKAGTEITIDYAFCESFNPMDFACKCGSSTCRKKITNHDWEIKELQHNYGKYFSPYLQKKFAGIEHPMVR